MKKVWMLKHRNCGEFCMITDRKTSLSHSQCSLINKAQTSQIIHFSFHCLSPLCSYFSAAVRAINLHLGVRQCLLCTCHQTQCSICQLGLRPFKMSSRVLPLHATCFLLKAYFSNGSMSHHVCWGFFSLLALLSVFRICQRRSSQRTVKLSPIAC